MCSPFKWSDPVWISQDEHFIRETQEPDRADISWFHLRQLGLNAHKLKCWTWLSPQCIIIIWRATQTSECTVTDYCVLLQDCLWSEYGLRVMTGALWALVLVHINTYVIRLTAAMLRFQYLTGMKRTRVHHSLSISRTTTDGQADSGIPLAQLKKRYLLYAVKTTPLC